MVRKSHRLGIDWFFFILIFAVTPTPFRASLCRFAELICGMRIISKWRYVGRQ
jgi:hypothetical protein